LAAEKKYEEQSCVSHTLSSAAEASRVCMHGMQTEFIIIK
jgi:hypothetical protein